MTILFILFFNLGLLDSKAVITEPLLDKYRTFSFNCHNPISVKYLDKDKRCDLNTEPYAKKETRDWDILAHPLKGTLPGHFCSIVKSSITVRCGLWSYNQIVELPETEVTVHISSTECLSMIQEQIYRMLEGQKIPLTKGKENVSPSS